MSGSKSSARGDRPDLLTAAIFVGVGALGLWAGRTLDFGSLASMGAGFVPTIICWLLIVVGLWVGFLGLRRAYAPIEPAKLRPILVITASIIGFAFVAAWLGFVAASLFLIVTSSIADHEVRMFETLLLAVGLSIFGALVFVVGLGVQIKLLPF
ncbi:tripartite tricarboxylate transporter TctB family protein [Devosia sp. XJ19-1]|uniref:Tripartite tricarboxylate transporter TctB family protein n=1 Tax=Devosia ureilytica TaxID=2952754 RepID=A0A9Q4ALB5_9HYPH|nr:tripartite tricarboxylate transporter TctB family protein [Devosia ureilytica]MCP8882407.1 tripartite tricarboxylate transporter TctB family protein [Devosia ureilytica]MCP8885706.1 tripartite tricarboxylate transporter TctB family protein [Devosia ureilytica]